MKGKSGCVELFLGTIAAVVTGALLMTFAPAIGEMLFDVVIWAILIVIGEVLYVVTVLAILIGMLYLVYRYSQARRFEQEQAIVSQQYAISEADCNEEGE